MKKIFLLLLFYPFISCSSNTLEIESTDIYGTVWHGGIGLSKKVGCGVKFKNKSKSLTIKYAVSFENIKDEKVEIVEFTLEPTKEIDFEFNEIGFNEYYGYRREGEGIEKNCQELFSNYKIKCVKENIVKEY
jgi:hypothetical protein